MSVRTVPLEVVRSRTTTHTLTLGLSPVKFYFWKFTHETLILLWLRRTMYSYSKFSTVVKTPRSSSTSQFLSFLGRKESDLFIGKDLHSDPSTVSPSSSLGERPQVYGRRPGVEWVREGNTCGVSPWPRFDWDFLIHFRKSKSRNFPHSLSTPKPFWSWPRYKYERRKMVVYVYMYIHVYIYI